jgi:hypothetical protein
MIVTFEEMCDANRKWQPINTGDKVPQWIKDWRAGKNPKAKPCRCNRSGCCSGFSGSRLAYAVDVTNEQTGGHGVYLVCKQGYQKLIARQLEVKLAHVSGEITEVR